MSLEVTKVKELRLCWIKQPNSSFFKNEIQFLLFR